MERTDARYSLYVDILHEELVPAMGCTEPIAIAYAAATARKVLGCMPQRVEVVASSNIIKNVKSVVVPNTDNLRGIEAAAVAGIIGGVPEKILEVISELTDEHRVGIKDFLSGDNIIVKASNSGIIFDLIVKVFSEQDNVSVQISNYHTNIVNIEKNGEQLNNLLQCDEVAVQHKTDRSQMSIEDIIDFAETANLDDVKDVLEQQIRYNEAIASEGLKGNWGANVGSVILESWEKSDVKIKAKAWAAAGSDARMSGCDLPVVIVSGSGNQGLTASMPIVIYAKELNVDQEKLYRALLVSNLITIHQKTGIGRLSAYCGAVSAGTGAGAGIAWLNGAKYQEIALTIINSLAITSGIICDGAKPSCAGKIASSVDAGILGYEMAKNGQHFCGGDGIIHDCVEATIKNIGRLGSVGMRETDKEIIKMMLGE